MKTEQSRDSGISLSRRLDWFITLAPFLCIVVLCVWFVRSPEQSSQLLASVRSLLGDQMGSYYLLIGLGVFFCSLYMAFSRFGNIRLGDLKKPE